jgi:type IV secretion system protein TrbJ
MNKFILAPLAALMLMTAPAHAQWIVFDPSNYAQNILTAAHTLETINNQVRQLQNDALNLTNLDFSSLAELRAALSSANQLIQQAQGLAYQVSTMQADFERLYPEAYTSAISGSQMALDARQRWDFSLKALGAAMRVQAQAVQNFASDENTLTDLVNRSQSAVGALQAAQATNQLLALQSRQAMQEQQLRVTQDRAVGLELARVVAAQERAREVRRRFQGDGTRYTPQTVNFYSP